MPCPALPWSDLLCLAPSSSATFLLPFLFLFPLRLLLTTTPLCHHTDSLLRDMTQFLHYYSTTAPPSSSDTHHHPLLMSRPPPLPTLLLSRLLPTLWALAADNPVPLAYILYFSPYITKAAGFLLPLILTTALLAAASALPILALLVPPALDALQDKETPTVAEEGDVVCGGRDAGAAGSALCTGLEAEEEECGGVEYCSGLLGTIWWELQGCVEFATEPLGYKGVDQDDALPAQQEQLQQQKQQPPQYVGDEESALSSPTRRDNGKEGEDGGGEKGGGGGGPHKEAPSPQFNTTSTRAAGVITWKEFEAIGKLYQALTQDIPDGLPIKLAAAAAVRAKVDGAAADKPSCLVLHQSTQLPNLPPAPTADAAPNKDVAGGNRAQLSRCHSRASPLEGWETPWGSELDGANDDDVDEEEEFFSTTQGLMIPWRSESMNWSRAAGTGGPASAAAAAALARFGGSMREGQWRRDTMLTCKSVSVQEGLWARSRSVAAGVDDEGMDMLWEEYDDNGGKEGRRSWGGCEKAVGNKEKKKRTKFSRWGSKAERRHDDDDVKHMDFPGVVEEENYVVNDGDDFDNDSEMGGSGKLCCLQALRFSTGRMRFGMGKLGTGLARASRAIKGTTLHRHPRTHAHGSSSSPVITTTARRAAHRKGGPSS